MRGGIALAILLCCFALAGTSIGLYCCFFYQMCTHALTPAVDGNSEPLLAGSISWELDRNFDTGSRTVNFTVRSVFIRNTAVESTIGGTVAGATLTGTDIQVRNAYGQLCFREVIGTSVTRPPPRVPL
jgi:hypothetical protein